ncbi:hypothetical protein ABBQ32_000280 [Trebouxia sp. C0010 RCD-2024]
MVAELGWCRTVKNGLNPLAPAFIPSSVKQAAGKQSRDTSPPSDDRGFGQLPDAVLATVLSCLEDPKDVLACAFASRHIRDIAKHAPLRLCVCPLSKLCQDVAILPQLLQAITRHFTGVHTLDLSNTLVDDADISHLMRQCTAIQVLKLAGCRKLTSVSTILCGPTSGLRLQFLSLQRCFQIGDNALTELLGAAAYTRQQLRCIALSHLQLQHWPAVIPGGAAASAPEDELANSPVRPTLPSQHIASAPFCPAGSGLQMLALHNCSGLLAEGLQAVATACPQLYMLCLGGSTIQVPKQSLTNSVSGGSYIPMLNSIPRSRAATLAGVLRKAPSCHHPSAHSIAVHLFQLILQLSQLSLLEITFLPYGVRSELRSLLVDSPCGRLVHVLDLCESKSITAAVEHGSRMSISTDPSTCATELKGSKLKLHLALLLEAAAHCSNAVRQTPLHVAVDVDDVGAVQGLLQLGAVVNARDKGGATPLFVACESGHATCAKLLLRGGADVLLRNSAGEAPLYIAALRGELVVVDALLSHMHEHGVCWQDGRLYGDGWTPLMAAAVADRHSVAVRLLSAAGSAVGALVSHANRYGQTAVHIAARKGSLPLLTALLAIGGPAIAAARDCIGISPADIASKNNHTAAVELLCSVAANVHTPQAVSHSQRWLK